jgi:SEC-C motif-containing protein
MTFFVIFIVTYENSHLKTSFMTIKISSESLCPCTSGKLFGICCGVYILGNSYPDTAEKLMRSRYTAYALGEIEYLPKTLPLLDRKNFDRRGAKEWSAQSEWLGLEVLNSEEYNGGKQAKVEFKAKFKIKDQELEHHEISRFEKQMGRWFLIDGKIIEKES